MRAILVDDEVANLENLKILLDKHCPDIKVVASASNIDEAFCTGYPASSRSAFPGYPDG